MGVRLFEGLYFAKGKIDKKGYRKTKILSMLKYVKDDLWECLFGKAASGLEAFVSERVHSKSNLELKEYVVFEYDPPYMLNYSQDNFVFKFIGAMLQGFMTYAGFKCKVYTEQNQDKDKMKFEYIFVFDEEVFDTKG